MNDRVLELGCGIDPVEGALHHDRERYGSHVDVVWDLDQLPWPWGDASFDTILAIDVFEHLRIDVESWLNECWRILPVNGTLSLRVPDYRSENQWTDPTHRRAFTLKTFDYWDPRTELHRRYGQYYFRNANRWWSVLDAALADGNQNIRFVLRKLVDAQPQVH